ncbi:peptide ABC superfamily ATP binding cassette [Nocardioides sp. CF8]|uniref:ABC transporter permease n=1 Tax=Nocardioides sp. CF8 TaxID=110319 RepID=UPI00032D8ACB|nr:ABC transporter permease [Nocardioides sp. CF8]EON22505.1 peptide ABC superfamily ATP binding cassette [Nocardioides sp. CF8]
MTRALRGAWSRRGTLLTLLAMTTVVVGGAVAVLGFAEAAGTSRWLMSPLLLLGAVAIPSIGRELAAARREEIGLARLRGIRGLRLGGVLLAEPLVTIVLGTCLGLVLGSLVARVAGSAWLDADVPALGSTAAGVALGTAAGSLLIVLLGTWATVTEPLSVQVATRNRPRRATTLVLFGSVLVIVGAAVAAYRSRQAVVGDPDVLVLLGPALVGLALGQVAIWVLRLLARGATGATATSGLSGFLATRRLSRADDLVTPMRLLVAAAVVGVLALTGASSVTDWVDGGARIAAGGPRSVPVEEGAVQALALTRDLDPEGQHLMAVAVVPNEGRLGERRAYVDAARFESVAGDFYDDTPAAAAAARIDELTTDSADLTVRGNRLEVASERIESGPTATTRLILELDYVTADGKGASIEALLNPRPGQQDRRSVRLPGCTAGCQVTGLAIARTLAGGGGNVFELDDTSYRVLLTQLSVGDRSLLDVAWQPDRSAIDGLGNIRFYPGLDLHYRSVANRLDGLEVNPLPDGLLDLQVAAISDPIPEFAAGAEPGLPLDIAGNDRVLGEGTRFEALPLLGGIGQLTDLPTSMVGSRPTVPDAETSIVVADDTPSAMLAALTEATGTKARSLEDVRRSVSTAAGADQSRAYALMAAFCALVALLSLAAGIARHLRSYRHDVASLRVLGVGLGEARRAGRVELVALAAVVLISVAAGGWLAVHLLLGGLPLVTVSPAAAPLDTTPRVATLVVPAVLAAVAMLVLGGRARAVRPSATRPSTLREEEGR